LPFDYDHFQASIVVEMRMRGSDNDVVMFVLEIHQFVGQQAGMVIVDQGDRTNHMSFWRTYGSTHQTVTDEVPERL
jgi:hypothetical protein